jgi:glycosyltransferase involved in cell wall biosynthesis
VWGSKLISIGMPVRNGAETLALALEAILKQTYNNIEIIISDNNSLDQTENICREFIAKDCRVRYFRQSKTISAIQNFRFVFEQSNGEYFMWGAHDDLRSENYIEVLLQGYEKFPLASIVFSDVVVFNNYTDNDNVPLSRNSPFLNDFDTRDLTFRQKHKKLALSPCYHFYGLINPLYLQRYFWFDIDYAPDLPLLHWLLCKGDFIYMPGATFYYYLPSTPKTYEQRAIDNSLRQLSTFPIANFAWTCATSVKEAELLNGRYHNKLWLFVLFFFPRKGGLGWIKNSVYRYSPHFVRIAWKNLKKTISWGST